MTESKTTTQKCWHCGKSFETTDSHDAYCLNCDNLSKEVKPMKMSDMEDILHGY